MRISDWSSDVCSSDLKVAPKKAAAKTIASKPAKAAPKPAALATKGMKTMNDTVKKFAYEANTLTEALTADFNEKAKEAMSKTSKLSEEDRKSTRLNSSHYFPSRMTSSALYITHTS